MNAVNDSGPSIQSFESIFLRLFLPFLAHEIAFLSSGYCEALVAIYRAVASKLQSLSVTGAALAAFSIIAGILWGAWCFSI